MKVHFSLLSWNKRLCGRDATFSDTRDIEKITCKACKNKANRLILHPITEQQKTTLACLGADI